MKAGGRGGSRRVESRNASSHLSSSSLHPGGSLHRSLIVDGAQVVPAMEEDKKQERQVSKEKEDKIVRRSKKRLNRPKST